MLEVMIGIETVMILYVLCKIFRRFYTDTEWDFCQKLRSTIGYILTEFFTYILKRNINTGKICNQSVKQLTSSGCILSNKLITYSKVTPEELSRVLQDLVKSLLPQLLFHTLHNSLCCSIIFGDSKEYA